MLKKKFNVFLLLLFFISPNAYAEVIEGKALVIDVIQLKLKITKLDYLVLMHLRQINHVKRFF